MDHPAETTANFIAAMGAAATGVSVVTTEGLAGRFGLTVSAISSVSAEPPMLLACVNRKSPAVAAMDRNGRFAVNVLGFNNKDVAEVFAGGNRIKRYAVLIGNAHDRLHLFNRTGRHGS